MELENEAIATKIIAAYSYLVRNEDFKKLHDCQVYLLSAVRKMNGKFSVTVMLATDDSDFKYVDWQEFVSKYNIDFDFSAYK